MENYIEDFSKFHEQAKKWKAITLSVFFNFLVNISVQVYTSSDGNSCVQIT